MDLTSGRPRVLNREAPWDEFDSSSYFAHNYRELREDDREIVALVRDFFADHFAQHAAGDPAPVRAGIDVGSGTNLYPALALLPWCERIRLFERAAPNVTWLARQVDQLGAHWEPFWRVLTDRPAYKAVPDPAAALRGKAVVEHGDLFRLPAERWDAGTMFFVAESLSTDRDEFETAVARFVDSLIVGAPFAMAFMENSTGYTVGDHEFPAYAVTKADVAQCLDGRAKVEISRIGIPGKPVRLGYTGMLVACGQRMS